MLIDQLKTDRLIAMKARDEVAKNLLGTLVAAASKDDKSPDDDTVIRTIRSFLKSIEETIGHRAGLDTTLQERERDILSAYLPTLLDQGATVAAVSAIIERLPDRSPKQMGKVMAELKALHGANIDMKLASPLVKAALSG